MAFKWRLPPNKIITAKIEGNGKTAFQMATDWARLIHKFVPHMSGTLGAAKIEPVSSKQAVIIYNTPYARRQYFGTLNAKGGVTKHNFNRSTKPLATHRWHEVGKKRGLIKQLVREMSKYMRRILG